MLSFIRAGNELISLASVHAADLRDLDRLHVVIRHAGGESTAEGTDAIEAIMLLKPSALEGRRFRWLRNAWMLHNLIGHPLMQLLSLLRLHRLAIRVHDATVPRPVEAPAHSGVA